ncbi:MAG: mechanosensitive ion channel family protein [Elusimicrobiota bacterium]|nr:MAG: mechanosensitive ion channel family protein [Elusimicrobiota bacterium]
MKFRAILAGAMCATLASPSAAQVRSAAGVVRAPAGVSIVPVLGPSFTNFSPSLNSAVLAPALVAPALTPALAAPSVVVPAAAVPVRAAAVPAAAAKPVALDAVRSAAASKGERPADASPAALRAEGEKFWSGASEKSASDADAVAAAGPVSAPRRSWLSRGAVLAPVAALAVPQWVSAAAPYAQGAALVGGAWALSRAVRWAVDKAAAKRGWERNTIATWRFVSSLAVWGGAAAAGLSMAGVSGTTLAETFGLGGTAVALAISLAVKDVAGNLFHGVHFLLSRPYTIGDKITVGKTTAVVRDMTLRYVVLAGEDGRDVLRTHSSLAAAPVTLYGTYQTKEVRLKLRKPALPHGLLRALRDAAAPTLWKPIVFSAAGIAALAFLPMLGGLAAAKSLTWAAALLPYLKAGLVAFLANSLASTLSRSIARLGERYGWNPAVVTVAKLGATVLTWIVGGSFLLNAVGVSWPWVLKTLSLGGALVSIAVVDYGTAIFNAIVVFRLKPFAIGDENVSIGEHTGTVVDITWQNVVLKLDDARYIIIPHAVVKDAEIKNPKKYGQRAEP